MSRGFEDARETASETLAEAVAKKLKPVYCTKCGSRLQIRSVQHKGFDKDTGYPKYDVILACPHATLYETDISREAQFTWKKPFGRHTVHKVSKVIELSSGITDAYHKRGDAYDEMPELVEYCPHCGKEGVQKMEFCPRCGQRLTGLHLEEKQRSVPKPEAPLKERNWFERHLNWTMVLAWAGSYLIVFIVWLLVILADPYISDDALGGISVIVSLIVSIAVGQWVLRKKNRSLAWLLICWTWFFLLIDNQSFMRDEYGRTMADYNKLIELDPDNANAYYERGDFYYEIDEYGNAIADYNKAIELDPNHVSAYYNRGCAYGEMGEYDKAIADYNKAIDLDPNDANAHYNRGVAYREKGEVPKAVSDLEKCIRLSTDSELTKDAQQALYEIKKSI